MNTLVLMVGLPRSGKSTVVKKFKARGIPVVCPDDLRLMLHGTPFNAKYESLVWGCARYLVESLIDEHPVVVLDATNLRQAGRDSWKGRWDLKFCYVGTDRDACVARAAAGGQDYLIPIINVMDDGKEIEEFLNPNNPNLWKEI